MYVLLYIDVNNMLVSSTFWTGVTRDLTNHTEVNYLASLLKLQAQLLSCNWKQHTYFLEIIRGIKGICQEAILFGIIKCDHAAEAAYIIDEYISQYVEIQTSLIFTEVNVR